MNIKAKASAVPEEQGTGTAWEHSTHQAFFDYYHDQSVSERSLQRFKSIRQVTLRILAQERGEPPPALDVADIGCGAGTQAILWSELGHRLHGLDVNAPLIDLARQRTSQLGIHAQFEVGSATELPWPSESMDVCLVPELLEHVADWEKVVSECTRILRPGGVLYLTTTNRLCPVQAEFNLPLYSWYPAWLKRRCVHLARTTHPSIAGYATYPAVHWFTYRQLEAILAQYGFESKDKFQATDSVDFGALKKGLMALLEAAPPLRHIAQVAIPYTQIVGVKRASRDGSRRSPA